jgi:hypothetical protein
MHYSQSNEVHFKTIEKLSKALVHSYIFPLMYDVTNDPGEVTDISSYYGGGAGHPREQAKKLFQSRDFH